MRLFTVMLTGLAIALSGISFDVEAKRLGGGRSSGMQRDTNTMQKAPAQQAAPQNAAAQGAGNNMAGAAQPKRSWMGPVAGLAAGLGLAALASHFGFGEELASIMTMVLIGVVVLAVIGFVMRRRMQSGPALAGAGAAGGQVPLSAPQRFETAGVAGGATAASHLPAGFDAAGFARQAKVNFVRLQAANDAGNLDDIRQFTTPEMFGEIKMDIVERGNAKQNTDVVAIEAEVVAVVEEAERYVASVRFTGMVREEASAAPAAIDEVWNLVKPRDGAEGWRLAGIQQLA